MTRMLAGLLSAFLAGQVGPSGSQKTPPPPETVQLANGWALLASGDAVAAAAAAEGVLSRQPGSVAAGALLIDAEIARAGAMAGLSAYERWLSSRRLEDAYLLRRAARALLWETAKSKETGIEALRYLSADDDADARAQLERRMAAGGLGETVALARIGDQGAVRRLIALMKVQPGSKQFFIEILIQSKSPLVIQPLTEILDDVNHPEDVASAADGLGLLKATGAAPRLRKFCGNQVAGEAFSPVQFMAAGALFRLNDMSCLSLLQRDLASEVSQVRLKAAEMMADQPDGTWMQVVRGLIGDGDPVVRLKAAKLLAAYDLDQARQTLQGVMADGNPAVQSLAAAALIERTVTDFATLRKLVRSPDENVRVKAAARMLELSR